MKFDFASLNSEIECDWPVKVSVPQDGGWTLQQEFAVRFRLIDDEELAANGAGLKGTKESLRKVLVGFAKSETAEWSDKLREQLLAKSYVRVALSQAYFEFASGIAAKNSETRPD